MSESSIEMRIAIFPRMWPPVTVSSHDDLHISMTTKQSPSADEDGDINDVCTET